MRTLLALVLLASCEPPESDHPLSDPAAAKPDPRLSGHFSARVKDADCFIHLSPGPGATVDMVLVVHEKDKGAWVLEWQAFPTTLGGKTYLNLQRKTFHPHYSQEFDLSPSYVFARYSVDKDGSLTLWSFEEEPLKKAVAARALDGEVKNDNVYLHASTARLAAFIEKGDRLFKPFGTFRRVGG